jgi:hypothetical protein
VAALVSLISGCVVSASPTTTAGEFDNPKQFRVVALLDGESRYESTTAAVGCAKKIYCDEVPQSPDCYCERYTLRADGFTFEWSGEARSGAHLRTVDNNLLARGPDGLAAVGELTITQRYRSQVSTGGYFFEFTGTFQVRTREHAYTQGVFYAPAQ